MSGKARDVLAKATDHWAQRESESALRVPELVGHFEKLAFSVADTQLAALADAGLAVERQWHPVKTEPRPVGTGHEIAGVYESADGLLWAFRATHWRPKP